MDQVYLYMYNVRCVCAHRVYMYVRVFIGVYAWIKIICVYVKACLHTASLYVGLCACVVVDVCMDRVYMYMQVIHKCICIHY